MMIDRPSLGGVNEKYAGAYLIPPSGKSKKKKKKSSMGQTQFGKTASAMDAVVRQHRSTFSKTIEAWQIANR